MYTLSIRLISPLFKMLMLSTRPFVYFVFNILTQEWFSASPLMLLLSTRPFTHAVPDILTQEWFLARNSMPYLTWMFSW